jgi:hypothetical protein
LNPLPIAIGVGGVTIAALAAIPLIRRRRLRAESGADKPNPTEPDS